MKHVVIGIVFAAVFLVLSACTPNNSSIDTSSIAIETYTLEEVQEDYDQFVDSLDVNPKLFTNSDELSTLIISQRELLFSGMTQLDFYRVASVVAAAIRCGHSMFRLPDTLINDLFESELTYPIEVRLFNGHLRIVEVTGNTSMELGDEITTIDGVEITELTNEMMRFISADGEGSTVKTAALSASYFSYYLLFLAEDTRLEVEFIDQISSELDVETINRDTMNTHFWVRLAPFESSFTEEYALLTVREFYPSGTNTLSVYYSFFETFFTKVRTDGITHVILDIRGNGGGDPMVTSRLFSYLAATSQPYFRADALNYYPGLKTNVPLSEPHFEGNLYTLIDGFCFSSTGHFAALLKYQEVGVFIGEETNGSYVCSDSSVELRLTNSRLTFKTSTRIWGVAVTGFEHGRGIFPDYPVSVTFEDYISGIDSIMEAALTQIENNP